MGRSDDVDDVVSEVYAAVWRRLDDALDADVPLAWMYGIAYKTIGNRRRATRRHLQLVRRVRQNDGVGRTSTDPAELYQSSRVLAERSAAVLHALSALKPADQELVRLAIWEELSHEEIAAATGMTQAAVTNRLHRARQKMQKLVSERDIGADPDTTSVDGRREPRPGTSKGNPQ